MKTEERDLTRDDIDEICESVYEILDEELDEEILRNWGSMEIREWVEEAIGQGFLEPKEIAQEIIDDYNNSL